jgi:hypothetical protein
VGETLVVSQRGQGLPGISLAARSGTRGPCALFISFNLGVAREFYGMDQVRTIPRRPSTRRRAQAAHTWPPGIRRVRGRPDDRNHASALPFSRHRSRSHSKRRNKNLSQRQNRSRRTKPRRGPRGRSPRWHLGQKNRSMPVILESQDGMSVVDGATIEPRIRINRPDDENARCRVSSVRGQPKDFSQLRSHLQHLQIISARTHRAFRASAMNNWREPVAVV